MDNIRALLSACIKCIDDMMKAEAKATPGPWYVIEFDDYGTSDPTDIGGLYLSTEPPEDDNEPNCDIACAHMMSPADYRITCASRNMIRLMLEYLRKDLNWYAVVLEHKCAEPNRLVYAANKLSDIARILSANQLYGCEVKKLLEDNNE